MARFRSGAAAVVILAAMVACSSSYTGDEPPADAGTSTSSSTSSSSTSSSGGSTEPDSGTDSGGTSTFGLACPTCAVGETCYAGGCDGLSEATCERPKTIGAGTYTVYVCAKASQAQGCALGTDGGTIKEQQIAAAFTLGTGTWKVDAVGPTPRVTYGSCAQFSRCQGGASKAALADIPGPTTLTVTTATPNATCQQVQIIVTNQEN